MQMMLFPVLRIGSIQYFVNLLTNVLNVLDEAILFVNFRLDMSQIGLSSHKWHGYVNGTQWLEPQAHLKRVLAD